MRDLVPFRLLARWAFKRYNRPILTGLEQEKEMKRAVMFGGAICTLLMVLKAAAPEAFSVLPLGGSPAAESGIVFGVAVGGFQLWNAVWGKD